MVARWGKPDWNRLKSYNVPDRFWRQAESIGRIDPYPFDPYTDSEWKVVPGLADSSGVSFQSVTDPTRYLRHASGTPGIAPRPSSAPTRRRLRTWTRLPTGRGPGAAIPLRRCSWPKPPRSAPTRSGAPSATSLRPRDPTGGGRLAIRLPRCPASLLGPHPPHRSAFALGGRTRPGAQCATPEWATRASRSSPSDIAVPRRLAAVAGRALVGHWSGGRQLRSCAVLVVDRVEPA